MNFRSSSATNIRQIWLIPGIDMNQTFNLRCCTKQRLIILNLFPSCKMTSYLESVGNQVCLQFCKEMDQSARSSRGKMTKIARSLAGKWTSLIVVLQGNVPAYLYFINNLRTSWSISLLSYEQSWSISVQNYEQSWSFSIQNYE